MGFNDFSNLSDYNTTALTNFSLDKRSMFEKVKNIGILDVLPQWMMKKSKIHGKIRDENHKHDTRADFNPNASFIGLVGECAFGHYYNLPVDWRIKSHDEFDFFHNGYFIDVKSTENNSCLNIKRRRLHAEDNYLYVYCVCNLEDSSVKIVGWLKGSEVLNNATLESKNNSYYYKIKYPLLHNMDLLTSIMIYDPVG